MGAKASMKAIQREYADLQGALPMQTHAGSVAIIRAVHGLCAGIQGAPPKQ